MPRRRGGAGRCDKFHNETVRFLTPEIRLDYTAARLLYEESLAIGKELGERTIIAHSLAGLGNAAYIGGDFPRARQCFEGSLTIPQEVRDRQAAARMIHFLGII